jgi:hypothetical protein
MLANYKSESVYMYISMDILKLVCRHIVNRLNYVVILIIQLNQLNRIFGTTSSLGTSACLIYPMQKKSWSPLPNLFHRVTGNPNHTIICLGLVCMYLLSHVIGGVMVSILALSVLDPWDRAPVWSNQRL